MSERPNIINDIAKALSHFPKPEIERGLPLQTVSNARQLGGLVMSDGRVIKENMLLRTAHLAEASEDDLKALKDVYNLSLVIDLRSVQEHTFAPDQEIAGAKNISHSLMESQLKGDSMKNMEMDFGKQYTPEQLSELSKEQIFVLICQMPMFQKMMRNLYLLMVSNKDSQKEIAAAFRDILDAKGNTVLWHCTQGKDRCGLLSVMILGALGADRETILKDFMISDDAYAPMTTHLLKVAQEMGADEATKETIQGMIGVSRKAMELALDWIENNYGSIPNYIKKALGLTTEDIEQLQQYYLI